jgi:hypothetical protein
MSYTGGPYITEDMKRDVPLAQVVVDDTPQHHPEHRLQDSAGGGAANNNNNNDDGDFIGNNDADRRAIADAKRRFPVEVFFYLAAVFVVAVNLGTDYLLIQEIDRMSTRAKAVTPPSGSNSTTALLAIHAAKIASGLTQWDVCDIPYFALENGIPSLQHQLYTLSNAAFALFWVALVPNLAFVLYRGGHIKELWNTFNNIAPIFRKERFHPTRNPEANPIGIMNVGNLTIAGRVNRGQRHALRGETSGYMFICLVEEIPQCMIFFLFIAFVQRYKGLECAECYQQGKVCNVSSVWSVTDNVVLQWAMTGTFLSVIWNYITLFIRWGYYLANKQPPWYTMKLFAAAILGTISFVVTFIGPIAIMFASYLEPVYYEWGNTQALVGLSAVSSGYWILGAVVFVYAVGLESGEAMFTGICCCDCDTTVAVLCPCCFCEGSTVCGYCLDSCPGGDACCNGCCPCCCCC